MSCNCKRQLGQPLLDAVPVVVTRCRCPLIVTGRQCPVTVSVSVRSCHCRQHVGWKQRVASIRSRSHTVRKYVIRPNVLAEYSRVSALTFVTVLIKLIGIRVDAALRRTFVIDTNIQADSQIL